MCVVNSGSLRPIVRFGLLHRQCALPVERDSYQGPGDLLSA